MRQLGRARRRSAERGASRRQVAGARAHPRRSTRRTALGEPTLCSSSGPLESLGAPRRRSRSTSSACTPWGDALQRRSGGAAYKGKTYSEFRAHFFRAIQGLESKAYENLLIENFGKLSNTFGPLPKFSRPAGFVGRVHRARAPAMAAAGGRKKDAVWDAYFKLKPGMTANDKKCYADIWNGAAGSACGAGRAAARRAAQRGTRSALSDQGTRPPLPALRCNRLTHTTLAYAPRETRGARLQRSASEGLALLRQQRVPCSLSSRAAGDDGAAAEERPHPPQQARQGVL